MRKLKESVKKAYNRIPPAVKNDVKEVLKDSYRYAKTAAIAKLVIRLTELKK
jgi:hypothetical protein